MSVRRPISVVVALALVAALGSSSAFADEDPKKAARAFREGQKAYAAGDFRRAAQSFEDAFLAKPHHDAMWNAARSWQKAGEPARAANDYAHYLDIAPAKAMDRDSATAALNDLTTKLGRVEVQKAGATNIRFDGSAIGAMVVYVAPGEHVAEAESTAGPVRKVFTVDAGGSVSVTLTSPPKPDPIKPPVEPKPEPPQKPLKPWVVYVGGGLTVVAAGITTWQGLDTMSKKDDFQKSPTQGKLDDTKDAQLRTNVALGGAVGFALITGALAVFLVDWQGPAKAQVGVGPTGVSVFGNF
jgi:hypothetical protein